MTIFTVMGAPITALRCPHFYLQRRETVNILLSMLKKLPEYEALLSALEARQTVAVSGISQGDFIITTSNKPVEAGKQVRLADNG